MRSKLLRLALLAAVPALLDAQQPTPPAPTPTATDAPAPAPSAPQPAAPPDTAAANAAFQRAQRLVMDGQGAAGRAIVDSVLAVTPTMSPVYPDALFWRASLAATAAEAERDYRRLSIEFPLSPRAEDSLMRLAQLEMARGDRALAIRHLERLVREHPTSASRGRAMYWMARIHFEGNDLTNGCAAVSVARASADPRDVELRNQLDFYAKRCPHLSATTAPAAPAPSTAAAPRRDPAPTAPASSTAAASTAAAPRRDPAPAAAAPVAAPAPSQPRPAAPGGTRYSVQVAAYESQAAAEQLRAKLAARGHDAYLQQAGAYWRVRVGHFATRAEAERVRADLHAKQVVAGGWVVEAEPR